MTQVAPGKPRMFHGWWVVTASTVGVSMCQTPIVFLTLGVFMIPLGEEFGWDRATVSLALSVGALSLAFAMPIKGYLLDRWGARRVLLPSMVFLNNSLWHFLGTFAFIGVVGAGANTMSYAQIVTSWFDKHRGLALGIVMSGVGFGSSVSPLLAQGLIDAFDWRAAYLGLGLIVLLIGFPIVYFFVRETPQEMGLEPDGRTRAESAALQNERQSDSVKQGLSRQEALRTKEFWMLMIIVFLFAMTLHGVQIHLAPLLRDNGMSAQAAAGAISAMGIATVVARISVGYLFDRFFAPFVAFVAFLFPLAGMLLLGTSDLLWLGVVCAVFIGIGGGAESDFIAYLIGRYFGVKTFGEIYGYLFGVLMFGTAVGPYAIGLVRDVTGSYDAALWACLGGFLLICFMTTQFKPFPKWDAPPH
jgi:MFS family permease